MALDLDRQLELVDADSHYYEAADCFTRFIEPAMRDRAITVERPESGRETIRWAGRVLELVPPGFFVQAMAPGSLRDFMRAMKAGQLDDAARLNVELAPEWLSRDARLDALDRHGVAASILFPTLGILFEHHLRGDVEATYANVRAFNRWLEEDWGFAYANRLFAAPIVSLLDPQRAVEEIDWVIDHGARVVCMKPGHAYIRSYADPVFDPFWARVQDAELVAAFHIGESGYNELYSVDFGENPHPLPHEKSALQWTIFYGDRPIMDTFASCILHNLFGRFPRLRFLSVENGSLWVGYLLQQMDKMKGMGRSGPWLGGRVEGRPSDIFREHVVVSPYPEDDVSGLMELLGPEGVAMGSDFPHPEGATDPRDLARSVSSLPEDWQVLFRGGNTRRLLGLPASQADR